MTTIVWDTNILAGDTLVGGDYSDFAPGFFDDVEWSISPKIFQPAKTVTYEGSPIIAVGGAGNVGAGNALIDYLLDRKPGAANPRPLDLKAADFLNHADATLRKLKEDSWLLILTGDNCWHVKSVLANRHVSIDDVTDAKTAIGAGAPHARASLEAGLDAIDSILDAATHPTSVTNFQILYVEQKLGTSIKRARRSHTTLKDPVRRNRLMKRSLAVAGSLLTGGGGWAWHAEGVTGFWQGAAILACLAGVVLAGWSMLTSLAKDKNAVAHAGTLLVALAPFAFPDGEAFIVKHNLVYFYLIYIAAFMVLVVIRMNCASSKRPMSALGIITGLTSSALLLTEFLINSRPYDLGVLVSGMTGVALGAFVTLKAIRYMERNYQAFKEHFVR